jgi:c-di-GMP-related signal transduction protein
MRIENFIVREPLLDPKQGVIGYDLRWQDTGNTAGPAHEDNLEALLRFVAEQLNSEKTG